MTEKLKTDDKILLLSAVVLLLIAFKENESRRAPHTAVPIPVQVQVPRPVYYRRRR